ncbi:MAG: DUF2283 domain-containing protein [Acidimicrobiales bacterium]
MLVTYDPEADATYVLLADSPVAKTRQFGDSVSVDLDQEGSPIGVELLMTPASVTSRILAPLIAEYPRLSSVVGVLHRLSLPATA